MTVKYEGRIPKTLRAYADRHAHQIVEISYDGGFCTDSGYAYDVLLRPGWQWEGGHTIIEPTIAATIGQLRMITPCDESCDYCKDAIIESAARSAGRPASSHPA